VLDSIKAAAKNLRTEHNVSIRVLDSKSGKVISSHIGHNAATNSLLVGIAHYLTGDGVLNQGYHMLNYYIPKYISLGTMGLINQDEDENGLPAGIGVSEGSEEDRFVDYLLQVPGYGADGYDPNLNNNREYFGLGPVFADRDTSKIVTETIQLGDINLDGVVNNADILMFADYLAGNVNLTDKQLLAADVNQDGEINCSDLALITQCVSEEITLDTVEYRPSIAPTINCELISDSFPRVQISYRDIVPETESEIPQTIDVIFSAMISTGALAQFREPGKDYIFITEAGLWSKKDWESGGDNGLLAGYRIAPPNKQNWAMTAESVSDDYAITYLKDQGIDNPTEDQIQSIKPEIAQNNRQILKQNIIRVGPNQVVQVIWKIQLGGLEQLGGLSDLYPSGSVLRWVDWE
jgi:hypothetical protein